MCAPQSRVFGVQGGLVSPTGIQKASVHEAAAGPLTAWPQDSHSMEAAPRHRLKLRFKSRAAGLITLWNEECRSLCFFCKAATGRYHYHSER